MKTIVLILLGVVCILGGLFLYLPNGFLGLPCLGWYKDLLILLKGSLGALVMLVGLVFFAVSK